MNYTASAFQDESSFLDLPLSALFEPIAEELEQTQTLYQETVLQTAESQYVHQLLTGEGSRLIPEEFRVPLADRISNHLLKSEGKWLRASLVLLTADACGVRGEHVRQTAVAVELTHLATLVHDDIIDEAAMRRGIQTVSDGWGNKIAVLLGDFLFSKAFKLLLFSGNEPAQMLLAKATGRMCLGEIKQLCILEQEVVTEQDYLETIDNKTASLMAAAAASGAILAGMPDETVEKAHGYGYGLGMAFQITDDVLDYTSSTGTLGKEMGIDLRNGKTTLPLIHLTQNRPKDVQAILASGGSTEDKTKSLLHLMRQAGSVEYAYALGRRYGEAALNDLSRVEEAIGSSPSMNSLRNLVEFVLTREK